MKRADENTRLAAARLAVQKHLDIQSRLDATERLDEIEQLARQNGSSYVRCR